LTAALSIVSCSKQGEASYNTQAVVTVKGTGSEQCYFQVDEGTIAVPENISKNPYGKEVRAFTLYLDKGEAKGAQAGMKYRNVKVAYLDSILTKKPAPNLGEKQNDEVYGTDPIDIYNSFMTVVEDGYVTLKFCAKWGYSTPLPDRYHTINLVRDTKKDDPYYFELRHNYCKDIEAPMGYYRDGVVAFNIKDILAKETKSTYDITLSYISHYGTKTIVFHYTPGTSYSLGASDGSSIPEAYFN